MIRYFCNRLYLWSLPLLAALAACTGRDRLPPPAPAAVEVKVPVPIACEIEQVPVPAYPAAQARKGMSAYELTKIVTADRRVRMAENERLRAANKTPCPGARL